MFLDVAESIIKKQIKMIQKKCKKSPLSQVIYIEPKESKGVIYESQSWYNDNYDVAAGYSTTNFNSTTRANVMDFLNNQMGEPYSATTFYYTWDKWSCVKLPWVGWYEKANINIAVDVFTLNPLRKLDGICFPDSIKKSPNTFQFSYGS